MEITPHYYQALTPELILSAIEQHGYAPSGHLLALNSYENRVYQIGLEDAAPVIAKFYRQPRWSDEAILEEHHFTQELVEQELPVIAPMADATGQTLFHFQDFRFALYPRCGGHRPDLEGDESLRQLGRLLGRMHAIGARQRFQHRPSLSVETYGVQAVADLRYTGFRLFAKSLPLVGCFVDCTDWVPLAVPHGEQLRWLCGRRRLQV